MAQTTGKLIVVAGIDGSGKTAQTKLLLERLRREGYPADEEEFPRYDEGFFGQAIARYLRNEFGPASEVHACLASVLYAGDRWEAKERMEAALGRGEIIVCNRYVSANLAHQGGKIASQADRDAFFQWVEELEYEVFRIPRPSLTVFLSVPFDLASTLVDKKAARAYLGDLRRDGHEADQAHLRHAQEVYEHLCESRPNWRRIECVEGPQLLSIEEIADRVWQAVAPVLR